jgi:putative transferase (TIGR04331 family)
MEVNFSVSSLTEMWKPGVKHIFAVEPYIKHALELRGALGCYEAIELAPVLDSTSDALKVDHDFIASKLSFYTRLLSDRLDGIHGYCYGSEFWAKAFALSILRHITLCYDFFRLVESHLSIDLHTCQILDRRAFRIPCDFNEHRFVFQHTDMGREQLFSVYCRLFHPGIFSEVSPKSTEESINTLSSEGAQRKGKFSARLVLALRRVKSIGLFFLKLRSPKLGVLQTSFSEQNLVALERLSWGCIQQLSMPKIRQTESTIHTEFRVRLARDEPGFDRFDKFVFASLEHGMPKMLVEDFDYQYAQYEKNFARYRHMRWVVSEWWIGDSSTAFALAVLMRRNVKHIYNEHNYLSHPWVGSSFEYLSKLADECVTIGWQPQGITNAVAGSSLFPWAGSQTCIKQHDILLILGVPFVFREEMSAAYGTSGSTFALSYLYKTKELLESIDAEVLSTMYVRSYPYREVRNWLVWDQEYILKAQLQRVKHIDCDSAISAKQLISASRLVVISYLATSALESLVANVPTILFLNTEAYFLSEEFVSFFDDLIKAGICQTDSRACAAFINSIADRPEDWWSQPLVQQARQRFLSKNVGQPDIMIRYLLKKITS